MFRLGLQNWVKDAAFWDLHPYQQQCCAVSMHISKVWIGNYFAANAGASQVRVTDAFAPYPDGSLFLDMFPPLYQFDCWNPLTDEKRLHNTE